jgi:hypothetical protein
MHACVCVYVHICSFFCFSEYTWHLVVWLFLLTEYWNTVLEWRWCSSMSSWHVFVSVFSVACVCVFCVTVCTGRQTDTVERLAKQYQHTRVRAHTCRDHSHTLEQRCWRAWRWFVLSLHTHVHIQTHKYACLFVCFCEYTWQLVAWLWFVLGPDTIIHTNIHTRLSGYVYICSFFVSPRYRYLHLDNNQLSALEPGVFAGLASLRWVCVFLVAEYWDTEILCLSESVFFLWEITLIHPRSAYTNT